MADALENIQGQPQASLAIGAAALVHRAAIVETEQSLNLSDDLAARAGGIEHLVEETPKGATHRIDAIAAIGTLVALGQQPGRDQFCEEQFEVSEALLADVLHAAAEGSQARAPRRKERSIKH
jgi:hypothetical protein